MSDQNSKPETHAEDSVRPHIFDGIAEFNKRLPNWWLFTLYATIAFSILYWFYYAQSGVPIEDGKIAENEIAKIQALKMASNLVLDDASLAQMGKNPIFTEAGKFTFNSLCAACHLQSLRGKSENLAAIGPNLVDSEWLHGGNPEAILKTITNGIPEKGMPPWGTTLGSKKSAELVAYILSQQTQH